MSVADHSDTLGGCASSDPDGAGQPHLRRSASGNRPPRFSLETSLENKMKTQKKFSIVRVLLVTLTVASVIGGIAWKQGFFPHLSSFTPSSNSIMVIMPYKHAGTWVFDDETVGLTKEPFVGGIPELMDKMVEDIPDAENGFRLLFSAQEFPDYSHHLTWTRGDHSGNWYYSKEYKKEGWLCPGLFKYYKKAPMDIYVKAEQK